MCSSILCRSSMNDIYTAVEVCSADSEGYAFYEVFKNDRPTGNFYDAKSEEQAIEIHIIWHQVQ